MTVYDSIDFVDQELDELNKSISKSNISLDDLYKVLIDKEIDNYNTILDNKKNNEGLLYDNPDYVDINDHETVYALLKKLIDMGSFNNIDEFNNFISFIVNHNNFKMLENLNELTNICYYVLAVEGARVSEFSEYSLPYVKRLKELLPEYLDDDSFNKYKVAFPVDLINSDGFTINELYMFIWDIEKDKVNGLKEDILNSYKISFNLFDESLNREGLGLFIKTLKGYYSNCSKKVKI